MTASYYSSRI